MKPSWTSKHEVSDATMVNCIRGRRTLAPIQGALDRFLKCAPVIGQSTRLTESTLES
jgi:hypothetical protein